MRYNKVLMENFAPSSEVPKFSSPEEELKYLRELVSQKEQSLPKEGDTVKPEAIISQTLTEYTKSAAGVQPEAHQTNTENPQFEKALENMSSLPHREKNARIICRAC